MFFTPEIKFGKQIYHYALDIWTLGFVFAEFLFKTEGNFLGSEGLDCPEKLELLVQVLGTKDLYTYLKKFGLEDSVKEKEDLQEVLTRVGDVKRKPWRDFETDENRHLVSREAYNLLSMMLRYDYTERITPKDAMKHPYFKDIASSQYYSEL